MIDKNTYADGLRDHATGPVRLLLLDYRPAVRKGLKMRLALEGDLEVIGEAGDATEAIHLARALSPDVILVGAGTPGASNTAECGGDPNPPHSAAKNRREEMVREVEENRLAKALRGSRKRCGAGRVSALTRELKRCAGRLLKLPRSLPKESRLQPARRAQARGRQDAEPTPPPTRRSRRAGGGAPST